MIMTKVEDFITIDKDRNLEDAIRLMEKHGISRLIVTDNNRIIGIITEEDIGRRLGTGRERKLKTTQIHVSSAMTKDMKFLNLESKDIYISSDMEMDIKYVTHKEDIKKMAEIMIKNRFSSLPIKYNDEIIGLVTKTDLIKCLRDSKKLVKDFYTKNPIVINPNDTIVYARKLMIDNNIKRLIVENGGFIVGIVTEKDIARGLNIFRRALDKFHHPDIRRLKVEDIMTSNPITVSGEDNIGNLVNIMLEKNISGIPVMDPEIGIITKTDLVLGIASGKLE